MKSPPSHEVTASFAVLAVLVTVGEIAHRRDPRMPACSAVLRALRQDFSALLTNTAPTLAGALTGLAIGVVAGLVVGLASGTRRQRGNRHGGMAAASLVVIVAFDAFPAVALAPAISSATTTDSARVILSTIAVLVPVAGISSAAMSTGLAGRGLTSARIAAELAGAPRWRRILLLELRPAVSVVALSCQVAVPAALLGAVFAELFGADRGLGVFIMNSLGQARFPDVWAGCLWVSALGLLLVATAKAAREALGWHQDGDPVLDRNWHPGLHPAATVALTLLVIVAGWLALAAWVTASGAVPWPWELGAWSRRPRSDVTLLASATGVTMLHWLVAVGFGVTAVMTATGVISAVPSLRRPVLTLLLALRSTPMIVLIPIASAVLGRGLVTVAASGALTTLLVGLISTIETLDRLPRQLYETSPLIGRRRWRTLLLMDFPAAVSALRSSTPVILPLALTGVLLCEWLATGDGLGTLIVVAASRYDVVMSWSAALMVMLAAVSSALLMVFLNGRPVGHR